MDAGQSDGGCGVVYAYQLRSPRRGGCRWTAVVCVLACAVVMGVSDAGGQNADLRDLKVEGTSWEEPEEKKKPGDAPVVSVVLETSTDAETLLEEGRTLIGDGRVQKGLSLLEDVRARWGQTLRRRSDGQFEPTARAIDRVLAELDPGARQVYLMTADAAATGLLGGPVDRVTDRNRLRRVVGEYFFSNMGDDAALRLASLALDEGDAHEALRWLRKLITEHPAPDVSEEAVWSRVAVAAAAMGDEKLVERAMASMGPAAAARLEQAGGVGALAASLRAMRREPVRLAAAPQVAAATRVLQRMWRHEDEFEPLELMRRYSHYQNLRRPAAHQLRTEWQSHDWLPVTTVVADSGRVMFKSGRSLVALDSETGLKAWEAEEGKPENGLSPGYVARWSTHMPDYPRTPAGVRAFGDRIGPSLTAADGVVYHIEGFGFGRGYGQSRYSYRKTSHPLGTTLAAHDIRTGKLKWRHTWRSEGGASDEYRIVSAPYATGDLVVVALERRDAEFWVAAVDRQTGEEVWRRYVCGHDTYFAPPWAPVQLADDGEQLYVATHRGLVLSLGLVDGAFGWVRPYERVRVDSSVTRRYYHWMTKHESWRDGGIFVSGGTVLVMPADGQGVLGLDQVTGQVRFKKKIEHYRDVIGRVDRTGVLVTGGSLAAVIDVETGERRWRVDVKSRITGRALITEAGVYVPTSGQIYVVNAEAGRAERRLRVSGAGDDGLVGNLASDGARLYAFGATRATALVDAGVELRRLTERIKAAPRPEDRFARALVAMSVERPEVARADLEAVVERPGSRRASRAARSKLFAVLLAIGGEAELDQATKLAQNQSELTRVMLARAASAERSGRIAAAAEVYRELLATEHGPFAVISEDGETLAIEPRRLGQDELARLAVEHPQAAGVFAEAATVMWESLTDQPDEQRLAGVVNLLRTYPTTSAARQAGREAVGAAMEAGRMTEASLLAAEMARSRAPRLRLMGLIERARLMQRRGWVDAARQAWRDVQLAADRDADPAGVTKSASVARVVEAQLAALADQAPSDGRRFVDPPWAMHWRYGEGRQQLMRFDAENQADVGRDPWLDRHAFVYDYEDKRIDCLDAATGGRKWQIKLDDDLQYGIDRSSRSHDLRGARLDHLAVMRGREHVQAFDLQTGQTVWRVKLADDLARRRGLKDMPWTINQTVRDRNVTAGMGLLFEKVWDPQHRTDMIVARDAWSGRAVWERQLHDLIVSELWFIDGRLIIKSADNRSILLLDPRTGRRDGVVEAGGKEKDRLAYFIVGFCSRGPIIRHQNELLLRDFDSGGIHWRHKIRDYRRFHVLGDTVAFLQSSDNSYQLIDLRQGRAVLKGKLSKDERGVYSVGWDGEREELVMITRNRQGQYGAMLAGLDGRVRTLDFGKRAMRMTVEARTMAEMGPWIAWVWTKRERKKRRWVEQTGVAFYAREAEDEKSAGEAAEKLSLPLPEGVKNLPRISHGPQVRAGLLLLPTYEGLWAYGSASSERGGGAAQAGAGGGDGENGKDLPSADRNPPADASKQDKPDPASEKKTNPPAATETDAAAD